MATTASSLFTRHKPAFLVLASQTFAATLHTLAQVLETGSEPTYPSVILLIRLSVTALFCTLHLWRRDAKDFPLGPREVRDLFVGGVSGATGFYCRPIRSCTGQIYERKICCSPNIQSVSFEYLSLSEATALNALGPPGGYHCLQLPGNSDL